MSIGIVCGKPDTVFKMKKYSGPSDDSFTENIGLAINNFKKVINHTAKVFAKELKCINIICK